ncbi:hypothetical protein MNB_SUP05-SYMBIONT-5-1451 [hydrothermal vent metagenome]|uniref:Uncharacterized protein n=1 Tax=hydrothermal vent metagenome TaxID=652676 RepID=A0A1W1E0L6_9ZZZZ
MAFLETLSLLRDDETFFKNNDTKKPAFCGLFSGFNNRLRPLHKYE